MTCRVNPALTPKIFRQIGELADEMGMLDKYRSAKNNDERKEALFVAIGKAYKEKQKIERLR